MDIADQSSNKGMFCFSCHFAPVVLYSVTAVVLYSLLIQRETVGRWAAETEVGGCQTWVLTRPILTGGLDPVRILKKVITEKMMPLGKVSNSTTGFNQEHYKYTFFVNSQ